MPSDELLINKEWKLLKKIGSGSFGEIFTCYNIKTNSMAACKLEKYQDKSFSQLKFEYRTLGVFSNVPGFCQIYYFGFDGIQNLYKAMVMEQLGPSIDDLLVHCHEKFSVKCVAMLADQMLKRVEYLHSGKLVHRDIKPENFLMGNRDHFNTVYIIDFGLSKHYIDSKTDKHIEFRSDKGLTGTARYCSLNTHRGYEQSRRDDLEALGFMFVFLLNGKLPWQGLNIDNMDDRFKKIYHIKSSTPLKKLCKNIPFEFEKYIEYCRSLKFEQKPDYMKCRKIFWQMMERLNLKYDFKFDWLLNKN